LGGAWADAAPVRRSTKSDARIEEVGTVT
jgi:hypothetical protein